MLSFSKIKTIERAHKNEDFEDWFFNNAVSYVEVEKQPCIESARKYDYLQLEVDDEELLEVLKNGEEVSEEKPE